MDKKKYYKYAGSPSYCCCEDPCPVIKIDRCNFNEFCDTSGGEWIEHDYGTERRPDKRCELWYSQSATIAIKPDKIKDYNSAAISPLLYATPCDDKLSDDESNQDREDGDLFVETHTVRYGTHTVVCTTTTEWIYVEDADAYEFERTTLLSIDNVPCLALEDYHPLYAATDFHTVHSLEFFRNGDEMDVYADNWVGSFPYSESHFTYEYNAEYFGTKKYLCVTPNLNWYTILNIPDCVWYPPGATLTQEHINEIEKRNQLERQKDDNYRNCQLAIKEFCPRFSPPLELQVSNIPSAFSHCINKFRPVDWNSYPILQETAYYMEYIDDDYNEDTDEILVARRIRAALEPTTSPIVYVSRYERPHSFCKQIPYGYTIEFYIDTHRYRVGTAFERTFRIVTPPQFGSTELFDDRNNDGYITRQGFRYTAPTSLPTGTYTDWLEYEVEGIFGEVDHCVIKLSFYKEDHTQTEPMRHYITSGDSCTSSTEGYRQEIWTLTVYGETVNEYGYEADSNWSVTLFGVLPAGAKTYKDIDGVTFRYYDEISDWSYAYRDEDGGHSYSSRYGPYSFDESRYYRAKAQMEAVTATISLDVDDRGTRFITSNNNVLESLGKPIKTTTTTVKPKLVKIETYTVWTDDGAETTETVKKTVNLPEHTVVYDWGWSPAESPFGPYKPDDFESFEIDISDYADEFDVDSFWQSTFLARVYVGYGGMKCDPDYPSCVYSEWIESGTTPEPDNYNWSRSYEIRFEVETSTEITYFD